MILPGLSAHHSSQSIERFAATLDWALRLTVVVVAPATVALIVLAGPLTVAFSLWRVRRAGRPLSALAVMAFSSGLMGFSLVKVLAPGFFARQDTARRCASASRRWRSTWTQPVRRAADGVSQQQPGLHAFLALNIGINAPQRLHAVRGLRRAHVLHHAPGWRAMLVSRWRPETC